MKLRYVIGLFTLIFTQGAFAHTFGAGGAGFSAGFVHPFMGLAHLLAMLAVGIWAAQIGGRARWLIPVAFVAMLALGGGMSMLGWPFPQVELGIAGSVIVFGLLITGAAKMPIGLGMSVVGVFALFHGYAHGAEMPQAAAPWLYALGFVLTTAILHGLGGVVGTANQYRWPARLLRIGGVALAAAGVWLLAAV